jgi:hypothetical protein
MVDPDVVAVSPSGLEDMAGALQRKLNGSSAAVSALRAAFARANVGTQSLDAIYRVVGLATDELPMLRRRRQLALEADGNGTDPFGGFGGHPADMVVTGAGSLTYTDGVAAARAGTSDAAAIAQELAKSMPAMPGIDGLSDVLRRVRSNDGDPDYAAALIDRLGPRTVARLGALDVDLRRSGDTRGADMVQRSVGGALATASHRIPDPADWFSRAIVPGRTEPVTGLMAPFLAQGSFDSRFLAEIGRRELRPAIDVPDVERSAQIWNQIAKDPTASALLYSTSLPQIMEYTDERRPLAAHEGRAMTAFSHVLHAATIDVRRTDPRAADDNITAVVQYFDEHPDFGTYDSIRNVDAEIIKDRWDDLVYSIASPVDLLTNSGDDPTRSGVELPPNTWKAILTDSMEHAPAAKALFAQALSWVDKSQGDIDRKRMPKDHDMRTPDWQRPNYWESKNIERIEALMNASGADAVVRLNKKVEAMADSQIGAVKLLATEINKNKFNLLGYEKDAGKMWLDSQLTHLKAYSKRLIKDNFGDPDVQAVGSVMANDPFEYRYDWQRRAIKAWEVAVENGYSTLNKVKYDGREWTGDPRRYEKEYDVRITRTGERGRRHLQDIRDIQGDWKKLAAYNAWLQDPAVANAVFASSEGR